MIENGKPVFVNSFNSYDNVPNESFTNGKALCLEDGTIVMESIDHIVCFNPDRFTLVNHRQQMKLNIKLIRLLVNGNFIEGGQKVDGNVIIDCAIPRAKDIWLNSNQNTVTLTFSGLNYFRPLQTCYRVRVKGIDDVWRVYSYFNGTGLVDSRGLLHLPMVGLKPGDYVVELQASVFPDMWDGCSTFSWTVHVSQPWWQATGAYVLLLLVIAVLVICNLVIFNRNTRMKAHLNAEESSIIKNINSFVERCKSYDNELLAPIDDELFGREVELTLSPEFLELMVKLMPYLRKNQRITMHKLTEVAQMDVVPLYHLLATNIYKSPRELIMLLRLRKAASLLKTTNKKVEDISVECQFYTPNYFIGNFFHLYKKTPSEYRNS
jgi:AraC-like DNA-binding protein